MDQHELQPSIPSIPSIPSTRSRNYFTERSCLTEPPLLSFPLLSVKKTLSSSAALSLSASLHFLDECILVNNVTKIHCEINKHPISVHTCLHILIFQPIKVSSTAPIIAPGPHKWAGGKKSNMSDIYIIGSIQSSQVVLEAAWRWNHYTFVRIPPKLGLKKTFLHVCWSDQCCCLRGIHPQIPTLSLPQFMKIWWCPSKIGRHPWSLCWI